MNPEWLRSCPHRASSGLDVVRLMAALAMLLHGLMRIRLGAVTGFGEFFTGIGLPFGVVFAYAVTTFEVVGALALFARRAVVPVCAGFIVVLTAGVIFVHGPEGWWVVGAGRNGAEYSVLLIACFVGLAWAHWPTGGSNRGSGADSR